MTRPSWNLLTSAPGQYKPAATHADDSTEFRKRQEARMRAAQQPTSNVKPLKRKER